VEAFFANSGGFQRNYVPRQVSAKVKTSVPQSGNCCFALAFGWAQDAEALRHTDDWQSKIGRHRNFVSFARARSAISKASAPADSCGGTAKLCSSIAFQKAVL